MTLPQSALIVDDEAHIRVFLKLILKEVGLQTMYEASNGEEALQSYRLQPCDVVLMDVNMAGLDGLQTLERFQTEFPQSFIIMITSSATRDMVEKCLDKGARHFIRKDTPRADIIQILRTTFEDFTPHS